MNENTLVCSANFLGGVQGAPEWVMYIPGGTHIAECEYGGKPDVIETTATASDVAIFQASLEKLLNNGGPMPFIGFDHKPGARAFVPKVFRWQDGDKPGIYIQAGWTKAGKAAVTADAEEHADYGYFSPNFLFSKANKRFLGLPSSGEIGSLTNNPAYRKMAAVAASNQPTNTMSDEEIAKLKADLEAAKANAAKATADLDAVKASEVKAKADLAAEREKQAAAAVAKAVEDGQIAAQDTASQDYWKQQLVANDTASAVLAKLPATFTAKAAVKGGQEGHKQDSDSPADGKKIQSRAQDLLDSAKTSGRSLSWQQAWNAACAEIGDLPDPNKVTAAAAA